MALRLNEDMMRWCDTKRENLSMSVFLRALVLREMKRNP